MKGLFITGTDTEVGKTRIAVGFTELLQEKSQRVAVMKPVASGCEQTPDGLRNADALELLDACQLELDYQQVNPYAFEPAIAPHIAAGEAGVQIDTSLILQQFQQLQQKSDCLVVEGAGGWLVPINAQETLANLAMAMQLPVILVVGIKLGCINHALLSAQAIEQSGLQLAGWVANEPQTSPQTSAMIETLQSRLTAPLLGHVPPLAEHQSAADFLTLPQE